MEQKLEANNVYLESQKKLALARQNGLIKKKIVAELKESNHLHSLKSKIYCEKETKKIYEGSLRCKIATLHDYAGGVEGKLEGDRKKLDQIGNFDLTVDNTGSIVDQSYVAKNASANVSKMESIKGRSMNGGAGRGFVSSISDLYGGSIERDRTPESTMGKSTFGQTPNYKAMKKAMAAGLNSKSYPSQLGKAKSPLEN
jgi:hypothetical protein